VQTYAAKSAFAFVRNEKECKKLCLIKCNLWRNC